MTLLACESFDGTLTTAQLVGRNDTGDVYKKWLTRDVNSFNALSFASYITDNGLLITPSSQSQGWGGLSQDPGFRRSVPATAGPLILGLWYRCNIAGYPETGNRDEIIFFSTDVSTTTGGYSGVSVEINWEPGGPPGTIRLLRHVNGSATILATSAAGVISPGADYYIELMASYGTSAAVRIRVNEFDWINGTYNTKGAETDTQFKTVGISGMARGNNQNNGTQRTLKFDDIYVCDGSGSYNNDLLGVVSVPCRRANAQGSQSDWANSDALPATDNYSMVNEQNVDDADYIQSSVVGERDTHEYTDITAPGPLVAGVCVNHRIGSTGGGRSAKTLVIDGADEELSADLALDGFLRHKQSIFELHPDGVSEWTAASVNSAEFGLETT